MHTRKLESGFPRNELKDRLGKTAKALLPIDYIWFSYINISASWLWTPNLVTLKASSGISFKSVSVRAAFTSLGIELKMSKYSRAVLVILVSDIEK